MKNFIKTNDLMIDVNEISAVKLYKRSDSQSEVVVTENDNSMFNMGIKHVYQLGYMTHEEAKETYESITQVLGEGNNIIDISIKEEESKC